MDRSAAVLVGTIYRAVLAEARDRRSGGFRAVALERAAGETERLHRDCPVGAALSGYQPARPGDRHVSAGAPHPRGPAPGAVAPRPPAAPTHTAGAPPTTAP